MKEPVWFRQNSDRSDRFARALEHGEEAHTDDEFAEELALVSALRVAGSEPALDQERKDRIFAAIMAEAPMMAPRPGADADEKRPTSITARRMTSLDRRRKRKASLLATATAAGIIAFGALGIELAKDALPGDLLYDIKRTTESISLDLTFADDRKALKHLEIASTRVRELEGLVERYPAGAIAVDKLSAYHTVLVDLDSAATAASRGVTAYAPQSDGRDLRTLRRWAADNHATLVDARPAIPQAVVNRLDVSIELLGRIDERAQALLARMNCNLITSGEIDHIGSLPSTDTCQDQSGQQRIPVLPKASSHQKQSSKADGGNAQPNQPSQQDRQDTAGGNGTVTPTPTPTPTPRTGPAPTNVGDVGVPELPEASAPTEQEGSEKEKSNPVTLFPLQLTLG